MAEDFEFKRKKGLPGITMPNTAMLFHWAARQHNIPARLFLSQKAPNFCMSLSPLSRTYAAFSVSEPFPHPALACKISHANRSSKRFIYHKFCGSEHTEAWKRCPQQTLPQGGWAYALHPLLYKL